MNLDWHETKQRIGVRIEDLRVELEVPGLSLDETNVIRGRIAELRNFIEGVEPGHVIQSPPSTPYV